MDEQVDSFDHYYSIIVKMEQKLNSFEENLYNLIQVHSQAHSMDPKAKVCYLKAVDANATKIQKFVGNASLEIQLISAHLHKHQSEANDINTRYSILTKTQKSLQSSIDSLKQELQANRKQIRSQRKLQSILENLEKEVHGQKDAINKLLLSQNKSTRLHNQILLKLEELEIKERNLIAQNQWTDKKELETERYNLDSVKYAALIEKKTTIYRSIDQCVIDSNRQYMEKFTNLNSVKSKIKEIDLIHSDLEISTGEQNFIIKEIMLNEGVNAEQMLYQHREALETSLNELDGGDMEKLERLKRKLGVPIHTPIDYEDDGRRAKVKTQPITMIHRRAPSNSPIKTEKVFHSNSVDGNLNKQSSFQLPKLMSNMVGDDLDLPIKHLYKSKSRTPTTTRGNYAARKKFNNQQIGNRTYKKSISEGEAKEEGNQAFDSHLVRIRTKNGYLYKNGNGSDSEKESLIGNKSEIVSIYEKLSKVVDKDMKIDEMDNKGLKTGNLSAYIKLGKTRKKCKQSIKNIMESRESDNQDNNDDVGKIEKLKDDSKQDDKIQVRKGLKTIYEGEEEQKTMALKEEFQK